MKVFTPVIFVSFLLVSCAGSRKIALNSKSTLNFVNEFVIPYNQKFQNTTVGGLSGIDYDPQQQLYYLICDDRSAINPARFYTAKISIASKGIDTVQFVGVHEVLRSNGDVYPGSKDEPFHTPDPEAIRYNARTKQLVWCSEGERRLTKEGAVLEDPAVNIVTKDGRFVASFLLPANMHMRAVEQGPRQNGVFEGASFNNDFKKLLVSVEEPLYEDGQRAGLRDSSGWIRIIQFDAVTREPEKQFAYRIDPVAFAPQPAGAFRINGVPDILAINDHQLLVLERSYSTGRRACTVKVYLAEMNGADDVSQIGSLQQLGIHPLKKRLLLNMDNLGIYTDNIEGVTFGPKLANGRQSLLFVADNNFSPEQITQFLLFEIE